MISINPLKLAVIIYDRGKGKKVINLLNSHGIKFHIACLGRGTAHTGFEAYLGLGEPEKVILLCICDDERVKKIFQLLKDELEFELHGTGIAFSVPLNSASSLEAIKFISQMNFEVTENESK